MILTDTALDRLAALLAYPEEGYLRQLEMAHRALAEEYPGAACHLTEFTQAVGSLKIEELQELFTRTFDLNPICAMEVGWQLYGDEYKRGEFLVKMRQILAPHDLAPSVELPDHLTRVLPLLERLSPEGALPLACEYVNPAVHKMLAGLEGKVNPFENVLKAVSEVLDSRMARRFDEVKHD